MRVGGAVTGAEGTRLTPRSTVVGTGAGADGIRVTGPSGWTTGAGTVTGTVGAGAEAAAGAVLSA